MFSKKGKKSKKLTSAKDLLLNNDWLTERAKSPKYVSKEYQDYGIRLAHRVGDPDKKSLYIKIAKDYDRALVEAALSFVDDYHKARNKASIFMWKLKELRQKRKAEYKMQLEKQTSMF